MGSSKLQDCDYVFEDKQEPMHEAKTQLRKLKARQLLVHAQETLHWQPWLSNISFNLVLSDHDCPKNVHMT